MRVQEAIEELTRYRKESYSDLHPYFSQAVDLSIEALDHILRKRKANPGVAHTILKGETEE